MTKREALRACRKLWLWLAANPSKGKQASPALDSNWRNHCPCCEYVGSKGGDPYYNGGAGVHSWDCLNLCPLIVLWPNGCMLGVYATWNGASVWGASPEGLEIRRQAAQTIADACIDKRNR